MGKTGKPKPKFKTFNPENIQSINAKKLQENESIKTQNSSNSGASRLDRQSREPRNKKYGGTSRSGLGSEEPNNTDVNLTKERNKVENLINSTQEINLSKIAQSEKHVDKPEPSQHGIIQENAQASSKVDDVAVDIRTPEEPNLTRFVEHASEPLEPIYLQTNKMNIINTFEQEVTKEVTPPIDMGLATKKEVTKPQVDNPSWINNLTPPQQIRHPFSSLNPDATEFTPAGLFGNSDVFQSTIVVPPVENANLPAPFMNLIRKEMTAHHSVPPGIILQTTNSFSNENFPKPPFQVSSSVLQELPQALSEPVGVMALPVRFTAPVPDLKHSTSSWQSEQIGSNYYPAERELPTPLVQGRSSTDYQISESAPHERKDSGTNWAQRTAQGLAPQPSSEKIPLQVTKVEVKTSTGNWSDDDYTEPIYPTPNKSSNFNSDSQSRNRDFTNKNIDNRKSNFDRRGGRGGGKGYYEDREHGRRNERHMFSVTEKTYPRDSYREHRPNDDRGERRSDNMGNSGDWQEGTKESSEISERHDNVNRKKTWSQSSFDNSKNMPDNRRGRGRQDDYRGRNDSYKNKGHDNRPYENRDDGRRGHSRQFARDKPGSSYRNNDTRPHFGNDTGESLSSHQDTTAEVRKIDESRQKSWRDRNTADRNNYFSGNRDDRSRDTNKYRNSNNPRESDSRASDDARYSKGDTRFRKERDSYFERGRGSRRGRFGPNNSYHTRNDDRRSSVEGTPAIVDDDSSKDSADNYHITDDSSSDMPEKNVKPVATSPENAWDTCDVTHDTDDSWNNDWNTSVDNALDAASKQHDWDVLHKVNDDNSKNQITSGNVPDVKEDSNVSKKACDDYPTLEQEQADKASANKYSIDDSIKWQQCERKRRSYEPAKAKDPRMEREMLNKSVDSADWGSGSTASSSKGAEPRLRQTRITSYSTGQDPNKEKSDQDFDRWEDNWGKIKDFTVVEEIQGNLFEQPKDYSLAHCVAEDLRMGSGIAVDFKREFKNLPDLLDQRAKQGGLATLHDDENKRFVYYLVTKRESSGKPTYLNVWRSLIQMRTHIQENEVKKLAIPRLGCGLDRLEWSKVKSMIEHLFKNIAVEIRVCNFQQDEDIPKRSLTRKLVVEEYPITKIAAGTLIFYFSTENGDVDENMQELSKQFNYLSSFKSHKTKNLGEIVYTESKTFGLCGCIVRKTTRDQISFKSLVKCAQEFNKKNRKFANDAFEYVAFQWVKESDYSDCLINEKIITVLINYLRDVDVYVCRGNFDNAGV